MAKETLEGTGYIGQFYRQSLSEKVSNFVRPLLPAQKPKAAIYQTYAQGIDGAVYWAVDWDIISKYNDFVIWKCSEGTTYKDPTFPDACQAAYDHKMSFGAYHFFRADSYLNLPFPSNDDIVNKYWPSPANDQQLQNLIASLKFKTYHFLCIDIEAYLGLADGKVIDKSWLNMTAKIFCGRVRDWMNQNNMRAMHLFVYTSNGYISSYAPDMANWLQNYDQWVAQWIYNPGSVPVTWEQLETSYYPSDTAKAKPFGNGEAKLWQWCADRFQLPGVYTAATRLPRVTDLDLFIGTPAAFRSYIGYTDPVPTPEPEPEPDPSTDLTELTERMTVLETKFSSHTHEVMVSAPK